MSKVEFILGDCRDVLKTLADNSIDAVVSDVPYELAFMGRAWDSSGISFDVKLWKEVYRVIKPGGHIIIFAGTRTYHRIACAIEDAGFEIRGMLQWMFSQGMPKGIDVSKAIDKKFGATREITGANQWQHVMGETPKDDTTQIYGRGQTDKKWDTAPSTEESKRFDGFNTTLKPAHEPICLARKPLECPTVADNVIKWGTGALNIGACRIGTEEISQHGRGDSQNKCMSEKNYAEKAGRNWVGRWPADIIFDETTRDLLDEQSGILTSGTGAVKKSTSKGSQAKAYGKESREIGTPNIEYGDSGGASRFFYCAKSSGSEKDKGCENLYWKRAKTNCGYERITKEEYDNLPENDRLHGNIHTTVKPVKLMEYLCKLVNSPKGKILDMFAGSGTSGVACKNLDFDFLGIDSEPEYIEISKCRTNS